MGVEERRSTPSMLEKRYVSEVSGNGLGRWMHTQTRSRSLGFWWEVRWFGRSFGLRATGGCCGGMSSLLDRRMAVGMRPC